MSEKSEANSGSGPRQQSVGDKVVTGACFATGAALAASAIAFIASGGNPVVAIAVASKVGTLGLAGAAGGSA
jgi:hypothetical protein